VTPFDEMTLGEVEYMTKECLNGSSFADADPMQLAGAVMFMTRKRDDPSLEWQAFKASTRMYDIKQFSEAMDEDRLDPTNGVKN
jgi:hypothetical protein